jgi:RND family efflux transporter MFP subunit
VKKFLLPVVILGLGVAAVTALVVFSPKPHPSPPQQQPALEVPVAVANPQTRQLTVVSQGNLQPKRAIQLVTQVGGQIVEVAENFADGAVIQKGDVLLKIDDRDYRHALKRTEAQVARAAEALASERGRAAQARREWRDLGDPAANALFLREPQIAAAEAELEAAKAERDQAQLDLDRTQIKAPFSGRIEETEVNLGQFITPGTPVATIYDASVAEVHLPLTGHQMGLLDLPFSHRPIPEGEQPRVRLRSDWLGKETTWNARLVRLQARIDTDSRFQYVVAEAKANEEEPPLPMGSFVEAEIMSQPIPEVVELPASALINRRRVYLVMPDNSVAIREVELLKASAERVWVQGDIPAGARVMVDKQSLVTEGMKVDPEAVRGAPMQDTESAQ